jgi:hypothetical protein
VTLHAGYITEEIERVTETARYLEAAMVMTDWQTADPHHQLEEPERVAWAREELRLMKLEAFARAGRRYQKALDAWQDRVDKIIAWRGIGSSLVEVYPWSSAATYLPPWLCGTVIQYVERPRPPIHIDFGHPA